MEQRQFIYSSSDVSGNTQDLGSSALVQRRQAIQLFLVNPQSAIELYPQLEEDLIVFFSQSSNPHADDRTGLPISGREDDYHRWAAVQHWARMH
jgi:hypothetical protein